MASLEELASRADRAYLNLFNYLPFADAEAYKKAKQEFETMNSLGQFRPLTVQNGSALYNCELPTHVTNAFFPTPVADQAVWDAFLNAFLHEMDPYSMITWTTAKDRLAEQGIGEGAGTRIAKTEEGEFITVQVFRNSPAANAGLEKGDRILEIEEKGEKVSTKGIGFPEFSRRIGGSAGTRVVLTVQKPSGEVRRVTIHRGYYEIWYADSQMLPGNILYLSVSQFGQWAADQLRVLIQEQPKAIGMILDLRANIGGMVSEAVRTVDMFVDQGLVVTAKNRDNQLVLSNTEYAVRGNEVPYLPMAVLIGGQTASAAEIVAQDLSPSNYGRAMLVGDKTHGKGTITTVYKLPNERQLHLTQYAYFTKNGKSPQDVGLEPNFYVKNPHAAPTYAKDLPCALDPFPSLSFMEMAYLGDLKPGMPLEKNMNYLTSQLSGPPSGERLSDIFDPGIQKAAAVINAFSKIDGRGM